MITLQNREQLKGAVLEEFENFASRMNGFLSVAFNEDGTLRAAPTTTLQVPIGGIVMWPTATAPTGYVLCDGTAINRVDYKTLFDVIGVTYGVGDGSLTFNVPDMRGRFALGKAASGTGSALAGTGGALDHTHSGGTTGATAPSGSSSSDGAHTHTTDSHTHTLTTGVGDTIVEVAEDTSGVFATRSNHVHTATTASGGGGSTSSNGAHTHTITVGSHTHSVPTTSANNPPYLVVNYIIRTS